MNKTTTSRVFSEVLSELAFLFGDSVAPEDLPRLEGRGYLASLPFHGGVAGSVSFAVSEALAVEIAANTLGKEPADPEAGRKAQDAVREVASVLGGHLTSALAGPETTIALSPPALRPLEATDWERLRLDPGTQCFAVNAQPAMLLVSLKPGEAAR